MNPKVLKIFQFRKFLLKGIEHLSPEQHNEIPPGYKNNIVWNLGHLIAVQQNLCYKRAGVPFAVSDAYISPYLPGTRPEGLMSADQIDVLKEVFLSSIQVLQADYEKDLFSNYSVPEMIFKKYGLEVSSIDDALEYVLRHEGYHAGYITALRTLINKSIRS